jgi:hypothetical protein
MDHFGLGAIFAGFAHAAIPAESQPPNIPANGHTGELGKELTSYNATNKSGFWYTRIIHHIISSYRLNISNNFL